MRGKVAGPAIGTNCIGVMMLIRAAARSHALSTLTAREAPATANGAR